MPWSQFFIKVAGIYFGNSVHDNWNWGTLYDRLTKKIHIWNKIRLTLRGKKLPLAISLDQNYGTQE